MRLCFGDFAFDSLARQLFRGPHLVHLSPKAFQLLQALVEARPNAVSKHDLQALVWPNTFVSDANLAVLIGEIRSALGDDPRKPRLIRTVYGFGYAFSPRQDIESLAILPLANTSAPKPAGRWRGDAASPGCAGSETDSCRAGAGASPGAIDAGRGARRS